MNASPSLDFDVMRATDLVGGPFTPPGFYYKTFIRPRRLWPLYEKVLRHAAGLGKLRASPSPSASGAPSTGAATPTCSWWAAAPPACRAARGGRAGRRRGARRRGPEPGGRLLAEGGARRARELAERARAAGVEMLENAPALGAFDGLVPVWQGDTLHQVRAAPGLRHRRDRAAALFPGNDLPGVMLSGGARRLIALYAVKPGIARGRRDRSTTAASTPRSRCSTPGSRSPRSPTCARTAAGPAATRSSATERRADARRHRARGARARPREGVGARPGRAPSDGGGERAVGCDLLVVSGGSAPATSLLAQAGARTAYDEERGHFALDDVPDGVHAAGEVAGARRARGGRAVRARSRAPRPRTRSASATRLARRAGGGARELDRRRRRPPGWPCRRRSRATARASASPACART